MKDLLQNIKSFFEWLRYMIGYRELVILLLLALLMLTGCSSKPEPAIKVVVQEIKVPVPVNCLAKEDVPVYSDYVKTKINKTDNDYTKVRKLIIRDFEHQKFATVAEAAMKSCSE